VTDPIPSRKIPHWLGSAVFLAVLAIAALVFRK